jgi:predicted Fe-Mo cluster-binding NifX family protein
MLKIAISATGPGLDADVDPRFGRCQYFIVVDTETMQFEALENSSAVAAGGAGISAAQMVANKGVEVVLTGNCGPNAYQTLSAADVHVVSGVSGRVRAALEAYRAGKLQPSVQPNVASHYGMGMGRSRGMGMGMGMLRGMTSPPGSVPQEASPGQEMQVLKDEAESLGQQLSQIHRRLEELE